MGDGYTVPPQRAQSDNFQTYAAKQRKGQNVSAKNKLKTAVVLELRPEWAYGNVSLPAKPPKSNDLEIRGKTQSDERDGQAGGIAFDISKLTGKQIVGATHVRLHLKAKKTDAGGYVSLEIHDDDNGDGKTTAPYEKYYPNNAGIDNRFKHFSVDDVWTAHKIKVNPGDDFVIYVPITNFLFNKGGGDNVLNLYHNETSEIVRISLNLNASEENGPITPLNIISLKPTDIFMLAEYTNGSVPDAIRASARAQDPLYEVDSNTGGKIKYKKDVGLTLVGGNIQLVALPIDSRGSVVIQR